MFRPSGNTVSGKAANNWPLRGGKQTAWEGGVRVAAFVSGGFLPAAVRGSFRDGYIHACDWYPTFIALAGGDPTDENARGVPAVDGVDMWPVAMECVHSVLAWTLVTRLDAPGDTNKLR